MFENVRNGECSEFWNCIGKHSEQLLGTSIILVILNWKSMYVGFEIFLIWCQDSVSVWLPVLKQWSDSEFGAMMSVIKFLSRHFFFVFFLYLSCCENYTWQLDIEARILQRNEFKLNLNQYEL